VRRKAENTPSRHKRDNATLPITCYVFVFVANNIKTVIVAGIIFYWRTAAPSRCFLLAHGGAISLMSFCAVTHVQSYGWLKVLIFIYLKSHPAKRLADVL